MAYLVSVTLLACPMHAHDASNIKIVAVQDCGKIEFVVILALEMANTDAEVITCPTFLMSVNNHAQRHTYTNICDWFITWKHVACIGESIVHS